MGSLEESVQYKCRRTNKAACSVAKFATNCIECNVWILDFPFEILEVLNRDVSSYSLMKRTKV